MQDIEVEIDDDDCEPDRKLKAKKNLPEVITYKKSHVYLDKNAGLATSMFTTAREKRFGTLFEFFYACENPNYNPGTLWKPDWEQLPLKLLRTEEATYVNSYGLDLFDNMRENEWKSMSKGVLDNHPDIQKHNRASFIDWII